MAKRKPLTCRSFIFNKSAGETAEDAVPFDSLTEEQKKEAVKKMCENISRGFGG